MECSITTYLSLPTLKELVVKPRSHKAFERLIDVEVVIKV